MSVLCTFYVCEKTQKTHSSLPTLGSACPGKLFSFALFSTTKTSSRWLNKHSLGVLLACCGKHSIGLVSALLLQDKGLNYCREVLQQDNASNRAVLLTCSYLKGELDHHKEFPTWLESVFGSLHCEVTHPEVLEALREFHRKGARLMTTNYDELLEHYCGLTIITIPGHLESEMVFTEATTSTF